MVRCQAVTISAVSVTLSLRSLETGYESALQLGFKLHT
jgi:hypothetical protein